MILFPDTNFFLHFRDAGELPWGEITSDDEVQLMVCRTVQREIDRKERELRGRAQKRARKFASIISEVGATQTPKLLRPQGPRVSIDYIHRWPPEWKPPSGLADDWGDDRMVADVLAYHAAADQAAAILTNDVGVYRTAEDHGVKAILLRTLPDWILPEETDERGKELARLKAENAQLKQHGPAIQLTTQIERNPVEQVDIDVVRFSPLSRDDIEQLLTRMREDHPLVTDFSKPTSPYLNFEHRLAELGDFFSSYVDQEPTVDEIRQYTEEAYPAWLGGVQSWLESLADRLQATPPQTEVTFLLSNTGTQPADGVVVEFEALGGILLAEVPGDDAEGDAEAPSPVEPIACPSPPEAPAWKRVHKPSVLDSIQFLRDLPQVSNGRMWQIPPPYVPGTRERDPHGFYWKERPPALSPKWTFTCEDFRHLLDPELFRCRVCVPRDAIPERGAVRIGVSVRNMRDIFESVVPVVITVRDGDTLEAARHLMPSRPRWLRLRQRPPSGPSGNDGSQHGGDS